MSAGQFPITVTLTPREMVQGAFVGVMRRVEENAKGSTPTYGLEKGYEEWGKDVEGALGEMAAAKALGVYWSGAMNRPGKILDVCGFQVRTTAYPGGHLIIRPDDPEDSQFLLVTGGRGVYTIHGHYNAGEAKRRDDWSRGKEVNSRPDAWWVPQSELKVY